MTQENSMRVNAGVSPSIAIMVPCYNEAITIGKVIADFQAAIPEAVIHVFDNNSSDGTGAIAAKAGAVVHLVPMKGKGQVVRTMFRVIDADIAVMVDGDDTYPADRVRELIAPVLAGRAEMVVGTRLSEYENASFRPLHVFGNGLVLNSINTLFGANLHDVLSGYRAFSRRFMQSMPVLSHGFEIETEMTIHALDRSFPVAEVVVPYGVRPEGSDSKLNTFRDGYRVLKTILWIFKDYRPFVFFGCLGGGALLLGLLVGLNVFSEFKSVGHVVGVARAVFAVAACLVGLLFISTGLVLDTVNRRSRELYVLMTDQIIRR